VPSQTRAHTHVILAVTVPIAARATGLNLFRITDIVKQILRIAEVAEVVHAIRIVRAIRVVGTTALDRR